MKQTLNTLMVEFFPSPRSFEYDSDHRLTLLGKIPDRQLQYLRIHIASHIVQYPVTDRVEKYMLM